MYEDKIDVIITWVDGNDPDWQEERRRYEPGSKTNNDASSIERYREWGILKYWFRAIERNMPWINKIYFITWGHYPSWLDTYNEKVVIVNHEDYIPAEFLPTFNSEVIEMFFHKIPGLSKKFIYFNDDMFPVKPLSPEDFFLNELPRDQLLLHPLIPRNKTYYYTLFNNSSMLNEYMSKKNITFKKMLNKYFHHTYGIKNNMKNLFHLLIESKVSAIKYNHMPVPYLTDQYVKSWDEFEDSFIQTAHSKFRGTKNVNHLLIRAHRMLNKEFVPHTVLGNNYSLNENINFDELFKDKSNKVVCLNDASSEINFEKVRKNIKGAFDDFFPQKSSFEK